jgi:phosphoribosylformimino-5-aminoimidazole carboxamide ribotide isomerase
MLLVIPTLTINDNRLNECIQAANEMDIAYKTLSQLPLKFCNLLRIENAKSLHIVDQDSFNENENENNFELIKNISQSLDITIQLQSNFTNIEQCRKYLDSGVYRIIINDFAFLNPDETKELISIYTNSKITFLINYKKNNVQFNNGTEIELNEYLDYLKLLSACRIYFNDIEKNSKKEKFDGNFLKEISQKHKLKITLIDGVYNAPQLWELQELVPYGIDSVIIGKAFYENSFPCQNIWRIAEKKIVQELIN